MANNEIDQMLKEAGLNPAQRKLCKSPYVALSKAKKYLYFVSAEENLESRFLLEAGLI